MDTNAITFDEFQKVDIRIGTILEARNFPEARTPAYQLLIDFGALGTRKSSAQITALYHEEDLIGKQVAAVLNFPAKQIAKFKSECLVLGMQNGKEVVLLQPQNKVTNGTPVR